MVSRYIAKSGADAAIIRIHGKNKAIAVSVDSANYCKAYPSTGGKQIVCENWRNLISMEQNLWQLLIVLILEIPENLEIMG